MMVNPGEFVERTVDAKALDDATRTLNQHEAVRKAVDLYVNEIERYDKNEEKTVNVWIFVLPEIIFERCKPLARRSGLDLTKGEFAKSKKEKSDLPLLRDVIDQSAEEIFNDVPDFHRQVKARLLKLGHTSQLIRETTLVPINSSIEPAIRFADFKIQPRLHGIWRRDFTTKPRQNRRGSWRT